MRWKEGYLMGGFEMDFRLVFEDGWRDGAELIDLGGMDTFLCFFR